MALIAYMNKEERFSLLLRLYLEGNITVSEQDEFFDLLATQEFDQLLEKQIADDLLRGREPVSAGLPPHISQEIMRNIVSAEKMAAGIIPERKSYRLLYRIAAAAVVLVAVTAYFLFIRKSAEQSFVSTIPHNTIINRNNSAVAKRVVLADGSQVTLQPQSALYYPSSFSDSSREVYLQGRAFFEVTHNPKKPFLVYTQRIITRVLGTSFYINSEAANGNEEVSVRTGRVQVSENNKVLHDSRPSSSIIVTPNQKAVYEYEKRQLEATLVEKPQPVPPENSPQSRLAVSASPHLVYEQEKLEKIFHQLEGIYGIEIIIENPAISNCSFTGDLSEEDLFLKLKSICLATRSSYEINGTRILIKGKGCE